MTFVEFTVFGTGNKVAINPRHVVSICASSRFRKHEDSVAVPVTCVVTVEQRGEEQWTVKEEYSEVRQKLQNASA